MNKSQSSFTIIRFFSRKNENPPKRFMVISLSIWFTLMNIWGDSMSAVTKRFADNLSDLIVESGKSIKDLAAEIGISSGALSKYQNDGAVAGIDALAKISQYFGVSTDWLLGLSHARGTNDEIKLACGHTGLTENSVSLLNEYFFNDSKKQTSKAIVAVINEILEAESNSIGFHYAVSLALNAAQHCEVIPGPHEEPLLLPHGDNGKEYNAIQDKSKEYGFLVYPPDMAVRYYIDMAKADISNIVQRVVRNQCCALAAQNAEAEE